MDRIVIVSGNILSGIWRFNNMLKKLFFEGIRTFNIPKSSLFNVNMNIVKHRQIECRAASIFSGASMNMKLLLNDKKIAFSGKPFYNLRK